MSKIRIIKSSEVAMLEKDCIYSVAFNDGTRKFFVLEDKTEETITTSMEMVKRTTDKFFEFSSREEVVHNRSDIKSIKPCQMSLEVVKGSSKVTDTTTALNLEFIEDNGACFRVSYNLGSLIGVKVDKKLGYYRIASFTDTELTLTPVHVSGNKLTFVGDVTFGVDAITSIFPAAFRMKL